MVVLNNTKNTNKATIIIHGVPTKNQLPMEKTVKKGVKNVLNALETGVLPGYGIMYLLLSKEIKEKSLLAGNKQSLAMEKTADVMESMYATLSENAGKNPIDAVTSTKKNLTNKTYDDTNYTIPAGVFLSQLKRTKETLIGVLRIDEVLSAKPLFKAENFGGNSGVIIYTSEGCPWCARTKEYLKSKGISFKEINVSRNPAAIQDMIRVSGQTGTPVTVIKGQAVVGFDVERLNALL